MPKYEIYTSEIARIHNSYFVEANSKEEALELYYKGEIGEPDGDIYDNEVIEVEVYEEN